MCFVIRAYELLQCGYNIPPNNYEIILILVIVMYVYSI